MRKALVFFILFIALADLVRAEKVEDFILEADKLSYSEDGTVVEAKGNVLAKHKDLTIRSNNLLYRIDQGKVRAWDGFDMSIEGGVTLNGDTLDYDLKERKGDAKKVNLYFEKANMTGDQVGLQKEEVDLEGSSFTGCRLKDPHYHISASRVVLYPDEGWLICYFGYFWIGGIPLVPVPAYIFDLAGRRIKNVPPIPEVGYNEQDGSFVQTRFAWILSKNLNGRILISYAEKNGWGGGVEGNYSYNSSNSGDFRVYYDNVNKAYGGLTHTYSFGSQLGQDGQKHFYGLFNIREPMMFDLITNFSYRERINYERVTVLPDVTLRLNPVPVLYDKLKMNGSLTYGVVSEESTTRAGRGKIVTGLNYEIPTDNGTYGLGLGYDQSWYENLSVWTKLTQITSYGNKWGDIDAYFAHMHYLGYGGSSPFNYERYNFMPSDEINVVLGYNLLVNRIGIDFKYYVPSAIPRELDYKATIGFHCFDIELIYKAMRREFSFGFMLVSR